MKNYFLLGLVLASLALGYVLQWPATNVVLFSLLVVVAWLWNEVSTSSDGASKTRRNDYAKVIEQIEVGEVAEPKHRPPALSHGLGENKKMFYDFVAFADKLNDLLQWGGWRLQEEPAGVGVRNYSILYAGLKVGHINLGVWSRMPYKSAHSEVSADIEIEHAHLFYYGNLRRFLMTASAFISSDALANWDRTKEEIDHSLTSYLWDAGKTHEEMPRLNMRIHGRSLAYFKRCQEREETSLG